jgi:hypothetical protein
MPAVVMAVIPAVLYQTVYRVLFPQDSLSGDVLKYSLVIWWLVASMAGWARFLAVATDQIELSTYANVFVCTVTFLIGPLLVTGLGMNVFFVVLGALVLANVYWW